MSEQPQEAKPLYPLEVVDKLLTAMEPVNQNYQVMASLLHVIPNEHPQFQRLIAAEQVAEFELRARDIANYARAAYGSVLRIVDMLAEHSGKLKPSKEIPELKLSLQKGVSLDGR